MNALGAALLLAVLLLCAGAAAAALASLGSPPRQRLLRLARRLVYLAFAGTVAASGVLLYALVTHDFSNEYVVSYTDLRMPLLYLLTALWGGQKGSLLFWLLCLLGPAALALYRHRRHRWAGEPWAIVVLMGVSSFFVACLLFAAPPFEQFLVLGVLPDGDGLNPLLQNPAMVYHPPTILAGYAIWAVPFAYSLAALIVGDRSSAWLRRLRYWNVSGWFLLTMGNLFGAFWAYTELGWGGFWGWDPVENASLMPWFTASALIHTAVAQERRGKLALMNSLLILVTFMLTLLGTFITRTGMVRSVHAFGSGSALGPMFLVFMVLVLLTWTAINVWRLPTLLSGPAFRSWISQEAAFLAFAGLMLAGAAVVAWGTLFPTLYEAAGGARITIEAPWFNSFITPLAVSVLGLLGICPLLGWARSALAGLGRWALLASSSAGAIVVALVLGLRSTFWMSGPLSVAATAAWAASATALVTAGLEVYRGWSARRARGEAAGEALLRLLLRARRRYGGLICHVGLALLVVGFSGLAYKIEHEEVRLRPGEVHQIGAFELQLKGLSQREDGQKTISEAEILVSRAGRAVATLYPAQHLFAHQSRQVTTEVDTSGNLLEDLYVALVGYEMTQRVAVLKAVVNPLVLWLWIATALLGAGTVLALWPAAWIPAGVLAEGGARVAAAPTGEHTSESAQAAASLEVDSSLGRVSDNERSAHAQHLGATSEPADTNVADRRQKLRAALEAELGALVGEHAPHARATAQATVPAASQASAGTVSTLRCAGCGRGHRSGDRFCQGCGTPLPLHCERCGCEAGADASFCKRCGHHIT